MTEILLLVPFRSILDCKLVSKQWKNLIDDPSFFKRYYDTSLALFCFEDRYVYCMLTSHGDTFRVHRLPLIINLKSWDYILELLSDPSNGVACVRANKNQFIIYNFFTGASYNVKDAPLHKDYFIDYFGFGYDRQADDCKMILVYKRRGRINLDYMNTIQNEENDLFWVYSLRDRDWKSFKGFPNYDAYDQQSNCQTCSFKGVLHWVVDTKSTLPVVKKVIVTYDLHTCCFGEMEVPTSCNFLHGEVAVLGGQLCYWIVEGSKFRVWVMKEYGVSESWTKLLSVNMSKFNNDYGWEFVKPIGLYEHRDGSKVVLFVCEYFGTLYWCNVDNESVMLVQKNAWQKKSVTLVQKNAWQKKRKRPKRKIH